MSNFVDMQLRILTPTTCIVDEHVVKIIADATNGSFALLPRHIDFSAPLSAGVLTYVTQSGSEKIVGLDQGVLVKCANEVRVSTRRAALAPNLTQLRKHIKDEFDAPASHTIAARSALAKLELSLIRRFIELEHQR